MIKAYAALEAGGKLEPFEYDPGALGHDQVEVEVEYCGICHSDLSMINNEWGLSEYPLVPGHEIVGRIVEAGANVTHLRKGQHVGVGWQCGYCMTCKQCMTGRHNLCANAQPTIVGHHGGFADRLRVQAASAIALPEGLNLETAGPLLCGGITVFNTLLNDDVSPTARVGVIGIGGLGHMALGFLNRWGCEVTAFTSSTSKVKEALKLGAHKTANSRDPEEIQKLAGTFDLIISTVNVKLDWAAYISTLAPNGRLHFVGAVLEPIELSAFPLLLGQLKVSGSPVGSPAMIATMLEFAARHDIRPVVEEFPMAKVNEAMAHLESGKARYRVVLKR